MFPLLKKYRRWSLPRSGCLLLSAALMSVVADAEETAKREPPPAKKIKVDFARDIGPIFLNNCYRCHGPKKQESNYRLDVRGVAMAGGDFGQPAILPGNSVESPLLRYVVGLDHDTVMPPEGEGKKLSATEVGLLRTWIEQGAAWPDKLAGKAHPKLNTEHWSFQPLKRPTLPDEASDPWPAGAIDAFILRRLKKAGLGPALAADRVTLIRRLYLDMHGLPPTPEQVRAFVEHRYPAAYARLVDRVLASPRYAERWARHWLDVVRFGETHGFEINGERPHAYHYRDYVIMALNHDLPYDQFIVEQLAGDVSGADAATGFLVGGSYDVVKSPDIKLTLTQRQNELADMVNTTGTTFLGMTVGCARCHSHKFDPIPQQDYYAIQAVFAGVLHGERPLRFGAPLRHPYYDTARLSPVKSKLAPPMVYAGRFQQPGKTHLLYRGDPLAKREIVAPGALSVLRPLRMKVDEQEQQRRLLLANWIVDPKNPLTARVLANRLWHYHFGTGIVSTPNDFGANGTAPSHPELLDWLAHELIQSGWSIKHLHRLILLSATYQQSNRPRNDGLRVDAGCRLLWRFPSRRLEAEAIRDSILHVSGSLDLRMGGPGFLLFRVVKEGLRSYHPLQQFGPAQWRRMIYSTKIRQEQDAVFGVFDCPDGNQVVPRRSRSTTPLQSLNLLNSSFLLQQAEILAARLRGSAGSELDGQVQRVFQLLFARQPDEVELAASRNLVQDHGLQAMCRALLNTNEFLFLP